MSAKDVLAMIKEKDAVFVDFRFTDPRGKWQHTTYLASKVDASSFEDGIMFDGSSIAGWKSINESDMILMPDTSTAFMDPFTAQPTLVLTGRGGCGRGPARSWCRRRWALVRFEACWCRRPACRS
jgi:glutamine synthetase